MIVRPDYYVFGAVDTLSDLPALAGMLTSRLALSGESAHSAERVGALEA
jgi:3-(3-hydroxy-phenyl)propionate hydroxylase/flavoprotein hydroxylase